MPHKKKEDQYFHSRIEFLQHQLVDHKRVVNSYRKEIDHLRMRLGLEPIYVRDPNSWEDIVKEGIIT